MKNAEVKFLKIFPSAISLRQKNCLRTLLNSDLIVYGRPHHPLWNRTHRV